jgi:phage terminase large subunit-like protein
MPSFSLTPKQVEATRLLAQGATHTMLFGGSRSTKTFLFNRTIALRAIKAPKSRHCMLRFRLGHIKSSIVMDTFPKMMSLAFPDVTYEMNKSDLVAFFENGSEIWFGGLDDKQRVEKILGNEYATVFFNECSQIPWDSRNMAITRLAQNVMQKVDGVERPLPLRAYYDENPPDKGHWSYRVFVLKMDPESRNLLPDPENYVSMQMNPRDNPHLPADYIKMLEALSPRLRKRFLDGEFRDAAPNALFSEETIDKWRVIDDDLPDMLRVVVAVDPSGSDETDNLDNDEIGICVCGLGIDGNAYLLEDLTCKAGPATWGRVATQAFERHQANTIVAEVNYGGAMVKNVIHTARPRTPFKALTASRGKHVRAEPVAALMDTGRVRMHGVYRALEDELCLVAGTLVETARGQIPIERVTTDDWVMTRNGFAPVKWSKQTGFTDELVKVVYPHGCIIATPCHPIFDHTKLEFVNASDVSIGQSLSVSPAWVNTACQSSGAGAGGRSWLRAPVTTAIARVRSCIEQFGLRITAQYLTALMSTTKTRILPTTELTIWNCLLDESTCSSTLPEGFATSRLSSDPVRLGLLGLTSSGRRTHARFAERHSPVVEERPQCTARVTVRTSHVVARPVPIYNLHVQDGYLPEYYANGALVHNCGFTTYGYTGERSPNRADAFIWGISELFPDVTKPPAKPQPKVIEPRIYSPNSWMAQ